MALTTQFTKDDFALNAPVVITLPAEVGFTHKIQGVQASYTSGGVGDVFITINAIEVYRSNVAEFNSANWSAGLFGLPNQAVAITVEDGGPGITGTLSVVGRTE